MEKIKVIVVDDSVLMRRLICDMLESNDNIEVIGTAINGQDLLNKLKVMKPDVITLDIEMPVMNGIETLKAVKSLKIDIPIIVFSSISQKGMKYTMECLYLGAFDFIPKPEKPFELSKMKDDLIKRIRVAYSQNTNKNPAPINPVIRRETNRISSDSIEAVVIGASTGGPKALYKVITKFPKDMNVPVFVVQHMPVGFTKAFADRLNDNSAIEVKEATDGETYRKGVVYVAPGGYHMEVDSNSRIKLTKEPPIWGVRPAVDKLFISASKIFKSHIVSAVLTGMGKDGSNGTGIIKDNGGVTISESETTCVIYGMPKAAFETGKVDLVVPIDNVADEIIKIVRGLRR
ncbi:two-component system chemotaxis response regulator CheB [Clostridium acetobutylicum]|uniref:Protein-glutamate methylesterase/protein-glutamine glutaminase n=1 Tax=Clostridium acetobutylicum (strain ATCC 824 / DSM 792 / JCM 1419 / IAM 19013 / LMG 5710 / NBRC 13948 / NRRL B-527 / VKM B-1787 / 2291 / W) TaxID=272562 RepID=CHEB_CLOAB|nr:MULTISPECIES: chemotaxis protein CheB [Clostridium]Q97GZ3.1 RecName: Full=Protein-glutamate methylesterase/protein-glutamine glutaminase [Clostridium acetobutylicum ATCC 824]AAK80179.1 Chemotaxis protein CheB, (CheY-like receiver domain and methylesterase domain) [Clostridium acetobutylicum ATCC 824]ADZ21273.1 Chemotaxis protein CheB, (CheY-like receiver domain and methylesterase domain) [Clostridium acetobutylicum EA 2018]AEI34290.1 methylesterase CheB/methylase CheR [Clostridium acetobutyl